MALFRRISDILRSNINDLISRAEDPEKLLDAAIEDMQRQLVDAKSRVALSIADEKRLQKHHEGEARKADEWETKAMAAVRAGREDLALEALGRKREHQAAARQYQDQLDGQKSAVDELKRALSDLSSKLDETRRKRTLLLARAKRAEAQRQLADTLTSTNRSSVREKLEQLEARVEQAEAQAEANWEIAANSGELDYEKSLSAEIEMLGEPNSQQELAQLQARVRELDALSDGREGEPPAAAALPAPDASTPAPDATLSSSPDAVATMDDVERPNDADGRPDAQAEPSKTDASQNVG